MRVQSGVPRMLSVATDQGRTIGAAGRSANAFLDRSATTVAANGNGTGAQIASGARWTFPTVALPSDRRRRSSWGERTDASDRQRRRDAPRTGSPGQGARCRPMITAARGAGRFRGFSRCRCMTRRRHARVAARHRPGRCLPFRRLPAGGRQRPAALAAAPLPRDFRKARRTVPAAAAAPASARSGGDTGTGEGIVHRPAVDDRQPITMTRLAQRSGIATGRIGEPVAPRSLMQAPMNANS